MAQQGRQGRLGLEDDGETGAVAPFGMALVEGQARRLDLVAERLEDGAEEALAAAHRQGIEAGFQRDGLRRQFGPVLAAPVEGGAEHLGDGHAQERRRDIGTVVDVGSEGEGGGVAARQADGIDFQEQARRAALLGNLRVEDMGRAGGEVERLQAAGVLVQQIPQVGSGPVRGGQGEQHEEGDTDDGTGVRMPAASRGEGRADAHAPGRWCRLLTAALRPSSRIAARAGPAPLVRRVGKNTVPIPGSEGDFRRRWATVPHRQAFSTRFGLRIVPSTTARRRGSPSSTWAGRR